MSNKVTKQFKLGDKEIIIIYDFEFYSEKDYNLDFKDFVYYQTKRENISSADELDWKFYNIKELKFISFNEFIDIITNLLSKVLFSVLRDDRSIMNSGLRI